MTARRRCRECWHDSLRSGLLSLPTVGSSKRFLGGSRDPSNPRKRLQTPFSPTRRFLQLSCPIPRRSTFRFGMRAHVPPSPPCLCVLWAAQTVARREVIISLNHLIISANYSTGIFAPGLTSVHGGGRGGGWRALLSSSFRPLSSDETPLSFRFLVFSFSSILVPHPSSSSYPRRSPPFQLTPSSGFSVLALVIDPPSVKTLAARMYNLSGGSETRPTPPRFGAN